MKRVVIGFLGSILDQGRWERWRPTVDLCRHEDLKVDRLELLVEPRFKKLGEQIAADIASASPETQVRPHELSFKDPWDFEEVYGGLLDFARGYPFRPDHEEYLIHITTGTHVAQICLFLLVESRAMPGKLLQSSPPEPRRSSRPGTWRAIDLDLSRYDRIAARFARAQREGLSFLKGGIDTRNAAFNRLIEHIEQVAIAARDPILLTGPTGAGKSRLARRIYELRRARHQVAGPYVEVNCATLRGDAAMSALFGHVRGAFTGALRDRPGLLRAADGGVLMLDEIGELGPDEQAMLLRAIEERVFLPVGSDAEVTSDFLLIAGTNRDLDGEVRRGRFREDLLSRLDLWTFRLPGLRERPEDIEPNLRYELERRKQQARFSREALARYLAFATTAPWRANFRDLGASVARMATLAPGGRITEEVVDEEIARLRGRPEPVDRPDLDPFDRVQLDFVLEVCGRSASLSAAGRELFAVSRKRKSSANDADRLRKYLARFGMTWDSLRA